MTTREKDRRVIPALAGLAALALVVGACGSSKSKTAATTAASTAQTTSASAATTVAPVATTVAPATTAAPVSDTGISAERCAANKAAGKITYLTSFDFAAAASILDVVVAKEKGYFDKMCLDVTLKAGFSTANYPLVASGQAQFSSAGNFTEILNFSTGGAKFVALADYGKIPIEGLVVRDDGKITKLEDLKGKTIGVKGDIPPSIVAMLAKHGLKRGTDYKEVLLDGFDPQAHLKTAIDALPVYKSNEPGQLDRAGVKYKLFDPADDGIPGSFGIIYTSPDFQQKNPTAVQDFVRASLKGYEFAVADPAGAVDIAVAQINAAGNQAYLTKEGETYRWQQESAAVKKGTPSAEPVGLVDSALFKNEVAAYDAIGIFKATPVTDGAYDEAVAKSVYDADGKLIWPAS
jgi:NitT/TauT family transport system substrate-binding protein